MKQASMANEACFISQRSLLRWASKLYSFFCALLGNFGLSGKVLGIFYY